VVSRVERRSLAFDVAPILTEDSAAVEGRIMRSALIALGIVFVSLTTARADDAILVLDASGSMWGKVDGKSKVEIARAVMHDMLGKIPAERRLGLVAYGHRREGDCNDIEEVVPVGTDRQAIGRKVDALAFKGKTPLSAAVRFAAEKLKYKEGKATVILVSDGAENCNVDPCALGRELEAAGVDFVVHVIGFGLASDTESAGLKCLAEATGGRYFGAHNAGELTAALGETVAAPVAPAAAPPTLAHVILRATELDGGPEIASGLTWTIAPPAGAPVFEKSDAGVTETDVAPGAYAVTVERGSDHAKGESKLAARAGVERTVTIPLEIALEAALTVTPSEAPAGSEVSVAWKGPNRRGDYITVVKPDAVVSDYMDYHETERGNPAKITLPNEPGDYEMRYVLGTPQRVLATAAVTAGTVEAKLTVPPTAAAGSKVDISWVGPNYASDWITIVKPDEPATAYQSYFDATSGNHELVMPLEPGTYEVRYVLEGKRVLARAPITVTDVTAMVQPPASVAAGAQFDVTWTGPGYASDWITIVKPDAPASAYASYEDASNESPASLHAAEEPGAYEVRYVSSGKKILARAAVTVTDVSATLDAPAAVASGAKFDVAWTGPAYPGDWITIVKPDAPVTAYASYEDASSESPASLQAGSEAGAYEVRYVMDGKRVLARRAIQVTAGAQP
jgi:Ca-activated chloride channel family protein